MSKRKALSKRVRFEVFKRDGFKCQYCGAQPPDALLEVDHINPVAEGGDNDMDNLTTACKNCNLGKGARLLSVVPQSLEDKAAEVAEREAQLKAFNEVLFESKSRRDDEMWVVADVFMERFGDKDIRRNQLSSIRRFLSSLPYAVVLEAMELAVNRMNSRTSAFRYFCGICWRRIKGEDDGEN